MLKLIEKEEKISTLLTLIDLDIFEIPISLLSPFNYKAFAHIIKYKLIITKCAITYYIRIKPPYITLIQPNK